MRKDAIFIGIEVDDPVAADPQLAAKLEEVCPVSIFASANGKVEIVDENIDECILCGLCIQAAPQGAVKVHKLYSNELLDAPA
jgi:NAD-dependent dihydropyrimidine dehydrogenase PreA subunit